MGRREKPIDAGSGPVAAFASDLRKLRAAAGNPSYRQLASAALYSPSVLSDAAGGHRLPTLPVTLAFARACGGDPDEWEQRWRVARGDGAPTEPLPVLPGEEAGESGRPRPAQLPIGPHDFVGRTAEFESALSATAGMADSRVPVVVRGPIGIGKTAFALRFAHRLTSDFPDGQLFADLSARRGEMAEPMEVMAGFLHALGVPPDQVPGDDMHRIGLYRSMLAERRVVVLLDNVRDEPQVRPLLARSLNSQIVITSRARLLGLDGVRRIALGPLPAGASEDLLRLLIGEDRVRAESAAAGRIARFCEHLPLALTIAGRKIAAQPGRRLSEIAARLGEGVNVADWLRIGDVGLADAVLPAYLARPPLAKHVLHMLAGGAGEVTPATLARTLHLSIESAEYAMDSLIDGGLLHVLTEPERYVMPPLLGRLLAQEADRFALRRGPDDESDPLRAAIGFDDRGYRR
ncbi:helix-turn-helix transcriptional regulator [Nocardia puris]|uniref:Helix-turn-helix protein n=2 Tax=Nocardia puris TaxID=208602 RepID=A0A366E1T6_9NOCA|nr:helix-turn-helix transcriptional regulator [Nocardia puris]MBF6209455.1 helix-turn-helix transcriptional regulator [Nocardia puris]MBF6367821.1 helix-turn-helix transcriptional regulator [Nocardia puris]MBF6461473.1 helix-turn-helix transcriptional regulator [Nocardia puris]RBO96283.1 helix-turn-helix protein [Nocardia puris]